MIKLVKLYVHLCLLMAVSDNCSGMAVSEFHYAGEEESSSSVIISDLKECYPDSDASD